MSIRTAIDSSARDYWVKLFGQYGEELCRSIPRRIKAALLASKKVASVDDSADVRPVAAVKSGADSMILEGLYRGDSVKLLFRATLDKEGNVSEINSIEIK
jgi:hypothetical protein